VSSHLSVKSTLSISLIPATLKNVVLISVKAKRVSELNWLTSVRMFGKKTRKENIRTAENSGSGAICPAIPFRLRAEPQSN
jgi:hypothetical protein